MIVPIAVGDTLLFERANRCIETGMQNAAIPFAGAVEDVARLLDDDNARAFKRKTSGDGTADNPRPYHGKVIRVVDAR